MNFKGLLFLSLLINILTYSQEKKITFNKELNYKIVTEQKKHIATNLTMYASKNGETLSKFDFNALPMMFFLDRLGMTPVSYDLNNKLTESVLSSFFLGMDFSQKSESNIAIEKLNTQETILGYPCQNYLIEFKFKDHHNAPKSDEPVDERLKICIDEKNEINNFPVLVKIVDQFSSLKSNNTNLKGLILKVGENKNYDKEALILKSQNPTDFSVYFDHQKTLFNVQKKADSLMLAYRDLSNDGDYDPMDSLAIDSIYSSGIPNYISVYKIDHKEEPSLAIDNVSNKSLLKKIPSHCDNLKSKIPTFSNNDLARHVYNYTGQICDMYLTQADYNTVDEKLTMDEIRREVLYFIEIREKLSQSDKNKLDNFLKNLD